MKSGLNPGLKVEASITDKEESMCIGFVTGRWFEWICRRMPRSSRLKLNWLVGRLSDAIA